MMTNIRGQEVPWSRAEAIHRQTEGSPLFVQEVLRYLVEEGLVVREDGRYVRGDDGAADAGIPEGLRDVIGRRLSRLSAECNRLLAIAAVIGRDFALQTLEGVAAVSEEELIAALEEATRVGVLEERSRIGLIQYRFSHAFFRQTLYEEMSAPRRLRMHQQVARALETQYAGRASEHAAELADHFSHSTDAADLRKAVEYGELSAQRAMSVFDYGEAARFLERGIDVQEVLDPDDKAKRCDLLLALGAACMPAGDNFRVFESIAPDALALAESLSDQARSSAACQLALVALARANMNNAGPVVPLWAARADRYASPEGIDRVYADLAMARSLVLVPGRKEEAWQLNQRALALARRLNDPEGILSAGISVLSWRTNDHWAPLHASAVEQLAQDLEGGSWEDATARTRALFLSHAGQILLSEGERPRAEEMWRQLADLAHRTQDANLVAHTILREGRLAEINGELEAAVMMYQSLIARAQELGLSESVNSLNQLKPLLKLGRVEEALAAVRARIKEFEDFRIPDHYGPKSMLSLCLAHTARRAEAQAALTNTAREILPDDGTGCEVLVLLLETAVLLKDRDVAAAVAPRLQVLSGRLNGRNPIPTARLLGEAAVLFGKPDEARSYYAQALEVCEKVRFRPEIALTRLSLAELLLSHYPDERVAAIEHLDFAIGEFREMKMQPSLERALRHRGLLKA